jgi:hypothetical protein
MELYDPRISHIRANVNQLAEKYERSMRSPEESAGRVARADAARSREDREQQLKRQERLKKLDMCLN